MFSQMPLNRPADALSQFTKDGHEGLAAAIVMTAVVDWRWPTKLAANYVRVLGWPSLRQELDEKLGGFQLLPSEKYRSTASTSTSLIWSSPKP